MRDMRCLQLLVVGAVAVAGLPLANGQGVAGVPFPLTGETYYYVATEGVAHNHAPEEMAVRFLGAEEVRDREGVLRFAVVAELVMPGYGMEAHGDLDALLDDPEAYRVRVFIDAATLERIEIRSASAASSTRSVVPLLPDGLVSWTHASEGTGRLWYDTGTQDPMGALWGQALATSVDAVVLEGWPLGGEGSAIAPEVMELAGVVATNHQYVRTASHIAPLDVLVTLALAGEEAVGDRPARHYAGTYLRPELGSEGDPRSLEVWLADGLALPARSRYYAFEGPQRTAPEDARWVEDLSLDEHRPGAGALPWGEERGGGSFQPRLGALGPEGPEDGNTGLAYPLAQAIASVRSDPTLLGLRVMEATGVPVLVKAQYEERDGGDAWYPLPEARWWLVFHDADGEEVIVESKRPAGTPVSVNREQMSRGVSISPDIEGVAPSDLPPIAPTIEGAIRAWEAVRLTEPGPPNAVYFALQRMADGSVRPTVWAGWSQREAEGLPFVAGSLHVAHSLVTVDADGLPRLASDTSASKSTQVGPLGEPNPPAPTSPHPLNIPAGAPALAAAGMGIAAGAGLLFKFLAPLYARMERGRVMEHPARRRLLALAEQQPGMPIGQARSALGIGAGAMMHHVAMLTAAGLLRVTRTGRSRRLYPARMTPQAASRDAVLRQPRTAALYHLARARPGVGLREAARELGVPPSSLQWHVARLRQAGLLERRGAGLHPSSA